MPKQRRAFLDGGWQTQPLGHRLQAQPEHQFAMAGKRRKAKFVHIGSVIDTVLKTHRRDSDIRLAKVWQVWDSVVGDIIAQNAKPADFKGRLLLVHVASSTWIHQLQFLKADIIEKLNHALDNLQVEDIKFKIGPLATDD